jgi:phosphate uptake regulator
MSAAAEENAFVLLGRYYERFADHAVQVVHRVIFQMTSRMSACQPMPR